MANNPDEMTASSALLAEDDLSQQYASGRDSLQKKTAAADLLAEFGGEPAQAEQQQPSAAEQQQAAAMGGAAASSAGNVATDITKGVIQSPRAVTHGAINAVNEVNDLAKSLSEWISSHVGDVDLTTLEYKSPEELKQQPLGGIPKIPNLDAPDSTTGKMIAGVSQFLTGFFAGGKLLKAVKPVTGAGQFAKAAAQGAISDFSAFDPHRERLSNLIQQYPALQNPVTEYLAASPDDGEAEGRFKNALEGLGLGVVTEGLSRGVKILRKAAIAKREQADAARIAGGTDAVRPEISDDAFKALGEVDQPVIASKPIETPSNDPAMREVFGEEALRTDHKPVLAPEKQQAVMPERPVITQGDEINSGLGGSVPATPLEARPYWRETDADGLDALLVSAHANYAYKIRPLNDLFVTDDIALAIGQGGNKGVMVELRGDALSGARHAKPGTGVIGGSEFRLNGMAADAVDSVTVAPGTKLSSRALKFLNRNFDLQNLEDGGIKYTRTPPLDMSPPESLASLKADAADIAKPPEQAEMYINFARIDTPDDVKAVIQNMADTFKPDIDSARRGAKTTFKQIELSAQQVNAWETLKSRRVGEPLNAEQSVAARQLWATSADKLTQMAKQAAATGSEADLFAFRKMMATHQTIQAEVIAARTETARALASWRIPTGSGAERFMEIDNALKSSGGPELSREMAGRIAALADNGMIHELDKFVEKGAWAKSRDAMLEAWVNGLLSGPKTHIVNMMSNTSVVFQQMYERKAAAKIAQFLGDDASVQLGEAAAQYSGMMNGFRDALVYARKSFMTGESGFGLGKVELPTTKAISSEALGMSSSGFVGRTVDVLGNAINLPTRALSASDEFFKTIGYRMELHALALRQATQEANGGLIEQGALKSRIAEIISNPPASVRLAAIDQATYQTFTKTPGELAKLIQKAKGQYPALNVILPFVRTPANIMTYTFERTPLAVLQKQFRADIAAGGARRDLAMARMATGTTIMMIGADMAMSGQITGKGPSNQAERQALERTGWQPYSLNVDGRYYAYNRLDPIGMTLGLSADMVDILANDDYGVEKEKNAEEVAVAVAMSIANNAMSKTYLSGVSDLMNAMSDPQRYGESFFQRLAGSAVPTGMAEVARGVDPYMREANSMVEAMMKRTPGLSDGLPVRRNLWGDPIGYQSGMGIMYDAFSPIYSKAKKPSAIDEEILRNEMNITMPDKKTGFDGVTVNLEKYPGAYSRFVQLAGNDLKHPAWNLGARDFLNRVVSGKHEMSQVYSMRSDGPDGGKYFYVRDVIEQYREFAKAQLLKECPQIKDEIDERKAKKL